MGSPKGSSEYGQCRRRIARDAPPFTTVVVDERLKLQVLVGRGSSDFSGQRHLIGRVCEAHCGTPTLTHRANFAPGRKLSRGQ